MSQGVRKPRALTQRHGVRGREASERLPRTFSISSCRLRVNGGETTPGPSPGYIVQNAPSGPSYMQDS
jgi:hypothetical protein